MYTVQPLADQLHKSERPTQFSNWHAVTVKFARNQKDGKTRRSQNLDSPPSWIRLASFLNFYFYFYSHMVQLLLWE